MMLGLRRGRCQRLLLVGGSSGNRALEARQCRRLLLLLLRERIGVRCRWRVRRILDLLLRLLLLLLLPRRLNRGPLGLLSLLLLRLLLLLLLFLRRLNRGLVRLLGL